MILNQRGAGFRNQEPHILRGFNMKALAMAVVALLVGAWKWLFWPVAPVKQAVPVLIDEREEVLDVKPLEALRPHRQAISAMICKWDGLGRPKKAKYYARAGQLLTARIVRLQESSGQLFLRRGRGPVFRRQIIGAA